jgi:hypothetical protein
MRHPVRDIYSDVMQRIAIPDTAAVSAICEQSLPVLAYASANLSYFISLIGHRASGIRRHFDSVLHNLAGSAAERGARSEADVAEPLLSYYSFGLRTSGCDP